MSKTGTYRTRVVRWVGLLALATGCGPDGSAQGSRASAIESDTAKAIPSNSAVSPSSDAVSPSTDAAHIEGAALRFVALITGGGLCRDANGNPIDADCSYSVHVEGSTLTYRSISGEESVFVLSADESNTIEALGTETTLRAAVEAFSKDDCATIPDGSTRLDIAWSDSERYALEPVGTCIAEGSTHPLRPIAAKVWELKLEYAGLEL